MRGASIAMSALMLAIFVAATGIAIAYYPEGARAQPLIIGIPAIVLCLLQLALDLRSGKATDAAPLGAPPPLPATVHVPAGPLVAEEPPPLARELRVWAWFLALIAMVLLAGFWVAIPLFVIAFLRFEAGTAWPAALGLGLGATAVLYGLFGLLLRASLHEGFVMQWLRG